MNASVTGSVNASVSDASIVMCGSQKESNDELLVAAAKAGDRAAFVELCNRHSKKLLLRLYRITRNRQDAEDVLQDSLMRAFLHLKSFEGRSSFSSWITRIAINSALMHLRKMRRRETSIGHISDEFETYPTWEPRDQTQTPEAHFAQREREALLRGAILRLPSAFREVMELRHAREYSTSEIAQILGISVSAVKTRLSRARVVMRASLLKRHRHHKLFQQ